MKKDDLALIQIKPTNNGRIQFTKFVQPICLPNPNAVYGNGTNCFVSGWGSTGMGLGTVELQCHLNILMHCLSVLNCADHPKKLQAALIPILPRNECTDKNIYGPNLSKNVFCAGYLNGGVDSCVGDSGGPFACDINGIICQHIKLLSEFLTCLFYVYKGRFTLLGLVSWGEGCAERNKPGVYTKIVDYLDWINENVES